MAKLADVSVGFMHSFLKIYSRAVPELYALVLADKVSCHKAARIADLPVEEQRRIAADIGAGRSVSLGDSNSKPSRYDMLVDAWNRCSDEERLQFYCAIPREEE